MVLGSPTPAPAYECNAPDAAKLVGVLGTVRGDIANRPALFGMPNYGVTIGAQTYFQEDNAKGCNPYTISSIKPSPWPTSGHAILLAYRGTCNFVQKARNAEAVGASALIVINDDDSSLPYMADDRSGTVNIPSVIVYKSIGDQLKADTLADENGAFVRLTFTVPKRDKAIVDLWLTPGEPTVGPFLHNFAPVAGQLHADIAFSPRFWIQRKRDFPDQDYEKFCLNQLYCHVGLQRSIGGDIPGVDVVTESLRQLCIFKLLNSSVGFNPQNWFQYANNFHYGCGADLNTYSQKTCVDNLITRIGNSAVSVLAVESCMANEAAALLQDQIDDREQCGVWNSPSVKVNGHTYAGDLNCSIPLNGKHTDVSLCKPFEAICSSYANPSQAVKDACISSPSCGMMYMMDCSGGCVVRGGGAVKELDDCGACMLRTDPGWNKACTDGGGISGWGAFLLVVLGVVGAGVGGYWWHRRQQRKLRTDIDSLLKQYLPLNNDNSHLAQPLNPVGDEEEAYERAPAGGMFSSLRGGASAVPQSDEQEM